MMPRSLIPVSETAFQALRQLILTRTGLLFRPNQRETLLRGILLAAEQAGTASLSDYFQRLSEANTDHPLWDDLVGELTVGETYFFRDPVQIELLREHILPTLIQKHRLDRRLRLWSAACATGEEPYTLAILLREILPEIDAWQVTILATDINKEFLTRARRGYYRKWSFRQTEPGLLAKYFNWDGSRYALAPQILKMVTFRYLNLAEPVYPSPYNQTGDFDLILFRNMAIYMSESQVKEISERLYRALVDGGWLLVGAAEINHQLFKPFTPRQKGKTVAYQKLLVVPSPKGPLAAPKILVPRPWLPGSRPGDVASLPEPAATVAPVAPGAATADGLYLAGVDLVRTNHLAGALQQLGKCLELDPGFALAHYQIAAIYANQGSLSEAQIWCRQAISLDPLRLEPYYLLALIYQEEAQIEAAIGQLKKVLYLDHSFCLAHYRLAKLFGQLNRPKLANHHRSQAIRLLSKLPPDTLLSGSEQLTAGQLLAMAITG